MGAVAMFTLIGAVVGALIGGVSGATWIITHPPDIVWDFAHVLGMSGGGGQETIIGRFQVHGKSNLDDRITDMRGLWRSDVNGRTLPMQFYVDGRMVAPEDTTGIPRKAEFNIYSAALPSTNPPRDGTVESKFFSVFGPFTALELTYGDGKKVIHNHFTRGDILKQLNDFRETVVQGVAPPGITRKDQN